MFVGNTQTDTNDDVTYITVTVSAGVDSSGLGLGTEDISDQGGAATAISDIQTAIGTLGTSQGEVGAAMTRLQFAINQAQTTSVSVAAAESRIRDANMAEEASNLTKFNILSQSGLAALAQANQAPGQVLALLR